MFSKLFFILKYLYINKFKFLILLCIIELYNYFKYIKLYYYYNNLQIKHKKLPKICIEWLIKLSKRQPNKRLFLNNLYTKELSNKDRIYKSDIKKFVYNNILLIGVKETKYDEIIFKKFYNIFKKNIIDDDQNIRLDYKIVNYSNDNITPIYKPIILYGLIKTYRLIGMTKMKFKGFKSELYDGIYIHYKIKNKNKLPILFFHGLGVGLVPYLNFLEDYDVIAPELPNLSNSNFTTNIFSLDKYVSSIIRWLKKKGVYKVDIMGHSFGTIIVNYMLGYYKIKNPKFLIKFRKKIYLEPVCFNCMSSTINRICYDKYKWNFNRSILSNINKLIFYYFIQKDIYIQATMKRFILPFEIFEYNIKMNKNTCILLSGKDSIIKSKYLVDYIKTYWRNNINLIYNENEHHGSIIYSKNKDDIKKRIFDFIGYN